MKSVRLMTALLVSVSVVGCASPDTTWVKPIYPTEADLGVISRPLADQIITHNETGERLGLWETPQPLVTP